ncbi:MAG TPA: hypothetical protein VGC42_04090 [Kofleriaceae bacterium]
MQSFLAESAPHRGRALTLAAAGLVASIASFGARDAHRPHHGHHRLHTVGHCSSPYLR